MALTRSDTGANIQYSGKIEAKVDYKDKSNVWLEVFKSNVESAIGAMADSIKAKADMTVPYKTGNLKSSGRIDGTGLSRTVSYGGNGITYGAYQERGSRADGSHRVRNYTTAGTGKNYLKNASELVLKEGLKRYLK